MKVTVENFGPVKEFSFDTSKSFHLIVGDNNVGKSYALSAYYAVLKALGEVLSSVGPSFAVLPYILDSMKIKKEEGRLDFKSIELHPESDIVVTHFYREFMKEFLQVSFASIFSDYIKGSYSEMKSISNKYSKKEVKITIELERVKFSLQGDVEGFLVKDVTLPYSALLRPAKQSRVSMHKNDQIIIYKNKLKETEGDAYQVIGHECLSEILRELRGFVRDVSDVHYLPASRSGLYQALSAFSQIIAELSKSRSFLSKKIELPGISQQLSDYFISLSNITNRKQGSDPEIEKIASKVESQVLKGKIEFDSRDKKLYYRPDNTNLRLDLSATSSMVSEVGPIVAYIRHVISRTKRARNRSNSPFNRYYVRPSTTARQVLIIEEPEAHLHPFNQIAMTKLYADLSKFNVSVVVTSHSNYIFNTLSNILMAGDLDQDKVRCDFFKMTQSGSMGMPQSIDEFGIDDNNFIDASEFILNEKMDLISRMQSGNNND